MKPQTEQKIPVIFLAFANEHDNQSRYLRGLIKEQRALRAALQPAVDAGLCQVVERPNATLDEILEVFRRYRDQISIFHYGGHADGYQLLLETAENETEVAHGAGLVDFFKAQGGLKLMFLNGCSTRQQALDLTEAGIPLVIGTDNAILDSLSTTIAKEFYLSLGKGNSITRAWDEAQATIKIRHAGDDTKHLFRSLMFNFDAPPEDEYPWRLHIRESEKHILHWSLLQIDPLFGLELPESSYRNLPKAPYKGLAYFREEDAPIFFGRAAEIRALYDRLKDPVPLILFYGKSGVGKSSLLFAGLNPRIKDEYEVIYIRRDQELGLTQTLKEKLQGVLPYAPNIAPKGEQKENKEGTIKHERSALINSLNNILEELPDGTEHRQLSTFIQQLTPIKPSEEPSALLPPVLKHWQKLEQHTQKPLLVILDQVEECFTRPISQLAADKNYHELTYFLKLIQPLFDENNAGIQGKLILSFRKEYFVEIKQSFADLNLPFTEVLLNRLERRGIMDAVSGVAKQERLRQHYKVQLVDRDNLPEIIADDLEEDKESPIAPILQIIMKKMWSQATTTETPEDFSLKMYQELKKAGTSMREFFDEQMHEMEDDPNLQHLLNSGLVLEILYLHTTDVDTSTSCKRYFLQRRFGLELETLNTILLELDRRSLLVVIQSDEKEYTTLLAHDTLAPVVRRLHNTSDLPGQRAVRILNSRMRDITYWLPEEMPKEVRDVIPPEQSISKQLWKILAENVKGYFNLKSKLKINLEEDIYEACRLVFESILQSDFETNLQDLLLNHADIQVVEAGRMGMRLLTNQELELIEESKRVIAKRKKALEDALTEAIAQKEEAQKQAKRAKAQALIARARQIERQNPTLALNLVWESMKRDQSLGGDKILASIYYHPQNRFFKHQLNNHTDFVNAVEFSPDDSMAVTASMDSTLKLWDIQKGTLIRDFIGHKEPVVNVVFSEDGKYLLTGSKDDTAILWDLKSGKIVHQYKGHEKTVNAVALSPDGKYVCTGSSDYTFRLWDRETEEVLWNSTGHELHVLTASFTKDSTKLLTGSHDKTAKLWDLKTRKCLQVFKGHRNGLTGAALSPDEQYVLTGSWDWSARLWDIHTGKEIRQFLGHRMGVRCLTFSPDGKYALTGSRDADAKIWEVETGKEKTSLTGHRSEVSAVAFSKDGQYILTGSWDNTAQLWYAEPDRELNTYKKHRRGVRAVAFSPDGAQFLTGSDDKLIKLWDKDSGKVVKSFKGHEFGIYSLAFSKEGDTILSASADKTARLWDIESGKTIMSFTGHTDDVRAAVYSPDGKWVLTGSRDKTAKLWNIETGNEVMTFEGHESEITGVAFMPNRKYILTGSDDIKAKIWDITSGKMLKEFGGHRFSIWDIDITPDGKYIATGSGDKTVALWDWEQEIELRRFVGHSDEVRSLTFSSDGETMVTGSKDKTIKVWDVKSGVELLSFEGHEDAVWSVALAKDDTTILSVSEDKTAKLWTIKIDAVEKGNIAPLTESQKEKYELQDEFL